MTLYTVHLYREMRLTFEGIEAESLEAAAAAARDKQTSHADDIEDCEGETLAALVDVAGDEEYGQSRFIDFEAERQRNAAPALLASLEAILPYAENEAHSLEQLKDSPVADAEAARAWNAVEAAQAAIADAAAGCPPEEATIVPDEQIDGLINALLEYRRRVAILWSIEDVQAIRPGLDDERAWEVLQSVRQYHDASIGINWEVLACHADMLFGHAPETGKA